MSILKVNARWAYVSERLRNNYWLLPTLMLTVAFALGFITLAIDRQLDSYVLKTGWLYMGGADGARSLLSTLAGATLTLAGVVFSMNIVALTMASQQFGPRLLYNFVRDLGSQITLGTFTSIFTFCIVVLREVNAGNGLAQQFVPHLSVTVAGIMALVGMGVLIYYVHHVAVQIQAPVVVANVGRELESRIKRVYKKKLERGQDRTDYRTLLADKTLPDFVLEGTPVDAPFSGYIQTVDLDRLLLLARRYGLVIKLLQRPGEFAIEGIQLMQVWPADKVTARLAHEIKECVIVGRRRTAAQDIGFSINEICEVGVRAMSHAINDPFTCIACIDWLAVAVEELFQRDVSPSFLCDEEDELRLLWAPITHEDIMDAAFNQIRHFGQTAPAVMQRLLEAYARIAGHTRSENERQAVRKHADMAIRACRNLFAEPNDVAESELRYNKVLANLAAGSEI